MSSLCLSVVFLLVSRQSAGCAIAALQLPAIMQCIGREYYPVGRLPSADVLHMSRLAARLLQVSRLMSVCTDVGVHA